MNNIVTQIKDYLNLPTKRKLVIIRMVGIYVYVTLLVKFIPLRFYFTRYLSVKGVQNERKMQLNTIQLSQLRRLGVILPWKISCLIESIAMHIFFKQQGIYLPIYLGLNSNNGLTAHAWNLKSKSLGFTKINF